MADVSFHGSEYEDECKVKSVFSELLLRRIATPYSLKQDDKFLDILQQEADSGHATLRSTFDPSTGLSCPQVESEQECELKSTTEDNQTAERWLSSSVESDQNDDLNFQPTVVRERSSLQRLNSNEINISRSTKAKQIIGFRQKLLSSLRNLSRSVQKFIPGLSTQTGDPLRTEHDQSQEPDSSLDVNFDLSYDSRHRCNEVDRNAQESDQSDHWKCLRSKTAELSCKSDFLPRFLLKERCNSHDCACIKKSWLTIRLRAGGDPGCLSSNLSCSKASDSTSRVLTSEDTQCQSQKLRCQSLQCSNCNNRAPADDWKGVNGWVDTSEYRTSNESSVTLFQHVEECESRNGSLMVGSSIDSTQSSWREDINSDAVPIFEGYSRLVDQVQELKERTKQHEIKEKNCGCIGMNETPSEDMNCFNSGDVKSQDPDKCEWKMIKWLNWMGKDLSQCEDYEAKYKKVSDSLTTLSGNETSSISDVYWVLTKVVYPDSGQTYEVMTGPNAQISRTPRKQATNSGNVFVLLPEN